MQTDTFNHADRLTFLERLGRLAGCTTWREPGGGSGVSYLERRIPTENAMALALAMARSNPKDMGPDIAYSVGTGVPHRRIEVVHWLASKLERGTGATGRRAKDMLASISGQAYDMVIGQRKHITPPKKNPKDFELLVNIGAGWLWIAMEIAVERAEASMHMEVRDSVKTAA